MFEVGYLTGGASAGYSSAIAGNCAAATPILTNYIASSVTTSVASQFLPSVNIPIDDGFNLNVSPAVMYGSSGFSLGANVGLSVNTEFGSIGASYGVGYSSNSITGKSGAYSKLGYGMSVGSKDFNLQLGGTNFKGGGINQETGFLGVGGTNWSLMYENDFLWGLGGDGGDRYRTTGVRGTYNDFSVGLNLFTGDPGLKFSDRGIIPGVGKWGTYTGGNTDDYRLGALYVGFGENRFGVNGEPVRKLFQNHWAHKDGDAFPIFKVLNNRLSPYFSHQTSNAYTTWW